MQMLHCLTQTPSAGGESEFADGFYVAETLRKDDPEAFHTLTTVPMQFFDWRAGRYKYQRKPMIRSVDTVYLSNYKATLFSKKKHQKTKKKHILQ